MGPSDVTFESEAEGENHGLRRVPAGSICVVDVVTIRDWPTGRLSVRPTNPRRSGVPVRNIAPKDAAELDAVERREWLDSLDYVLQSGGPVKVQRLLRELTLHATENGVKIPFTAHTPYVNTT